MWRPEDGQREDVDVAGEYLEAVPPWEHFGYDMTGVGGWFDLHPMRDYSELLEETDEWTVRRNGAGAALKYWKHHIGTPEHIDFLMTTRAVRERDYRPHLLNLTPNGLATSKRPERTWAARAWAPGCTWATCSSGRVCARAWVT